MVKKKWFVICLSFISIAGIIGILFYFKGGHDVNNKTSFVPFDKKVSISKLKTNYGASSYIFDLKDLNKVTSYADYVFIGKVNEIEGTTYENIQKIKLDGNEKTIASTYTDYKITVIENLKGKLKKNTPLPIQKEGGIDYDQKSISLLEDDFLPENGKYYIFVVYVQKDGTLLIPGGINMNTPLTELEINSAEKPKQLQQFINAISHQDKSIDRTRFKSKYEE